MNPDMNQAPQPEMQYNNSQIPIQNPQEYPTQNQIYQVIQSNSTKTPCEKFSKALTGSSNIPLMVFIILMISFLYFSVSLIVSSIFKLGFLALTYFADFLFAIFVWSSMAVKIEKNTSTVKYGCLFLINSSIISVFSLTFPLLFHNIWSFILFETLLIALSNKEKNMKFFCWKLSGNTVFYYSIIYNFVFNFYFFWNIIVTIAYTYIYKKYLINKFGISNQKVEKMENFCLIQWIKDRVQTFVPLKDVLEKEPPAQQPLVSNIQNSNNSSFIPMNLYPNYYSGIIPGMQQMMPMPPMGQAQGIRNVESN